MKPSVTHGPRGRQAMIRSKPLNMQSHHPLNRKVSGCRALLVGRRVAR